MAIRWLVNPNAVSREIGAGLHRDAATTLMLAAIALAVAGNAGQWAPVIVSIAIVIHPGLPEHHGRRNAAPVPLECVHPRKWESAL